MISGQMSEREEHAAGSTMTLRPTRRMGLSHGFSESPNHCFLSSCKKSIVEGGVGAWVSLLSGFSLDIYSTQQGWPVSALGRGKSELSNC